MSNEYCKIKLKRYDNPERLKNARAEMRILQRLRENKNIQTVQICKEDKGWVLYTNRKARIVTWKGISALEQMLKETDINAKWLTT